MPRDYFGLLFVCTASIGAAFFTDDIRHAVGLTLIAVAVILSQRKPQ